MAGGLSDRGLVDVDGDEQVAVGRGQPGQPGLDRRCLGGVRYRCGVVGRGACSPGRANGTRVLVAAAAFSPVVVAHRVASHGRCVGDQTCVVDSLPRAEDSYESILGQFLGYVRIGYFAPDHCLEDHAQLGDLRLGALLGTHVAGTAIGGCA